MTSFLDGLIFSFINFPFAIQLFFLSIFRFELWEVIIPMLLVLFFLLLLSHFNHSILAFLSLHSIILPFLSFFLFFSFFSFFSFHLNYSAFFVLFCHSIFSYSKKKTILIFFEKFLWSFIGFIDFRNIKKFRQIPSFSWLIFIIFSLFFIIFFIIFLCFFCVFYLACPQQARERSRLVVEEQNQAYLASLVADQAKVRHSALRHLLKLTFHRFFSRMVL